ncbi:MAG: EamA family transporter [Oscillospiraceae bacterium]|nr:EamA family transporter [Oscillospiraceae bacterium]
MLFVAVLSYIFFKEKLTKRQLIGMMLIISGTVFTVKIGGMK